MRLVICPYIYMYINPPVSDLMLTFNLVCWSYELLLLPFCQIKALWHQQGRELLLIGYVFNFWAILCKQFPIQWLYGENPSRSAVSEILRPDCPAAVTIPQSKSLRSDFFPILCQWLQVNSNEEPTGTRLRFNCRDC